VCDRLPDTALSRRYRRPVIADAPVLETSPSRRAHASGTQWMDLARVVAIGAVVIIHVVGPVVSGASGAGFSQPRWWVGNVLDSTCRTAVPLFIMVSGALLLSSGRRETVGDFYRRRLRRIGVPLVFWSGAYLVFRATVQAETLDVEAVLRTVASGTPFFHLYFLFVIAGLYLATPFLRLLVDQAPEGLVVVLCLVLLGVGAADQVLMSFLGAGRPNAVTFALPYAGYFVAGHLLARRTLTPAAVRLAGAAFVLSTAATAVGTWFLARPRGWGGPAGYLYGYLSPTVIVASIAAFVLLRALPDRLPALERRPMATIVSQLSALSFGLYLIHPALLVLYRLHGPHPLPGPAAPLVGALLVQWLVVTVAALALTAAIRAVPFLRRIV
jgi:surface polysaccharide O-acyltransferase-like enzyme